jgi:hypothetical protein
LRDAILLRCDEFAEVLISDGSIAKLFLQSW